MLNRVRHLPDGEVTLAGRERVPAVSERHLPLPHEDVHVIPADELRHLPSVVPSVNQIASVNIFHHSCSFLL